MVEFDQNLNPVEPPRPTSSFTPPPAPPIPPADSRPPMMMGPYRRGGGVAAIVMIGFIIIAAIVTTNWRPASNSQPEGLTVNADSTVYATPDIAKVTVGATKNGATVAVVESQLKDVSDKVKTALLNAGIKEADIKTVDYNIYPQQTYSANSISRIIGYTGHYSVEVTVRDLNSTDTVLSTATTAGANEVGQLNFTLENPDTTLAQARKEALTKAKDKAKQMASDGGFHLGRLVSVSEYNQTPITPYDVGGKGGAVATPSTEPGSLAMQVTVTLVYQIR